ncbi:MAG: cobyric acid synthase [Chloroflexota bacterium]
MVQGTASSAGKSVLVTALCRILAQDGLRVAPFKSQNMALNSFVAADGGEIGRSQAVQAEAAGAEMSVHMNPILLKPEAETRCQVVVRGRPFRTLAASEYYACKDSLWPVALESLLWLRERYDVVVIEGAGSPAEVNLKQNDIVNMRVAKAAEAPVLLVADIDRGGVFAALVGTLELLDPDERALVRALVINKFRGDVSLLRPGLDFLEERTGVPVAGVIPLVRDLGVADEDSVSLEGREWRQPSAGALQVALVRLPHIANFDDFDALRAEPDVALTLVEGPEGLGQPDLIILPGTKTTVADLDHLRQVGLADAIVARARAGTPVLGICGGYQMLGQTLRDPLRVESPRAENEGLGLLPVDTTFAAEKSTERVCGAPPVLPGLLSLAAGEVVEGYEIHMGHSEVRARAALRLSERGGQAVEAWDGAVSDDGLVVGTYVHGLFDRPGFRGAVLRWLAERKGVLLGAQAPFDRGRAYDRLAEVVREHLDLDLVYRLLGREGRP